jgi:aspartyl-tRNA(Asn)/glutamyl-tRNA(Gln) amidotransferase subunit C
VSSADIDTVRALARLARLALAEGELVRFQGDLDRILEAFSVLARHPGASPAPSADEPARTRADRPVPSLGAEVLLAGAPAQADGFFLVPKTVGGES